MSRYLPADRYENGRLVEDGSVSIAPQRDSHGPPTIRITYMRDVAHVVEQTEAAMDVDDVRALIAALEEVIR